MPDGRVLHADHDGVHVLRVVGEIRYTMAPTLERFLAALVDVESTRGFVVDLTQCTLIDSTNLGLLGFFKYPAQLGNWHRIRFAIQTLTDCQTAITSLMRSPLESVQQRWEQ